MAQSISKISVLNMYKLKNILKSKHFVSSFCFLFSTVSVAFLFMGALITLQSTHDIQSNMESEASYAAISVQDILNSAKNSSTLVGSLPSVCAVLNNPQPTIDLLSDMIKDVSSFSTIYDYDHMGIFFESSRRIYDSEFGFYSYSDYLYPEFLEAVYGEQTYERWLLLPSLEKAGSPGAAYILTYIHRLPLYETRGKGFITFSLSIPYLKSRTQNNRQTAYPATVCFQDQLLWSTREDVQAQWDNTKTPEENAKALFPRAKTYAFSTEGGTQVSFYISTAQLFSFHLTALRPLFFTWLVSVLFTFVLSFLFSLLMLRPMDAMMRKMGLPPYIDIPDAGLDEYSLLNNALDHMSDQLKNIDSLLLENRQLIQDQLLHDILYGYVDVPQLSTQYKEYGISFPHPYFCLILMALPKLDEITDFTRFEQTRLLARNNAVIAFSNLGVCHSTYLGNKHIALIINTQQWEHLRTELLKICVVIKTSLQETLSLCPLFSITLCSPDSPKLRQALVQAQRILFFSSGETSDFVYFSSQKDYTPTIDSDLSIRMTQCIMDKDPGLLNDLADEFQCKYLPSGTSLQEAKRISNMMLCSVFVNLMELNIEIKENVVAGALSKLEAAPTNAECIRILFGCLHNLTGDTARISDDAHSYIYKAIRYLEAHYTESLSIPLIASHTGVSAIYLNRIFKLSTGKTVSEYLNDYRIARSLPMLADSSKTIVHISEAVGYGDVRSYIRFFKKFYGMTPSEYRKNPPSQP